MKVYFTQPQCSSNEASFTKCNFISYQIYPVGRGGGLSILQGICIVYLMSCWDRFYRNRDSSAGIHHVWNSGLDKKQ